jgi:hypothetical protein
MLFATYRKSVLGLDPPIGCLSSAGVAEPPNCGGQLRTRPADLAVNDGRKLGLLGFPWLDGVLSRPGALSGKGAGWAGRW